MNKYDFGYPKKCNKCTSKDQEPIELRVEPFLREGNTYKLMIVGQDPTVQNDPEKVKEVLMLNDNNSQLSHWLTDLFGKQVFNYITIYATNLVKCSFKTAPSKQSNNIQKFLEPYFKCCQQYIKSEIQNYSPDLVITLGEPAHRLFVNLLNIDKEGYITMQEAYTGGFRRVGIDGIEFDYSPCLHIKTFRVADTYGERVKIFKDNIRGYFK